MILSLKIPTNIQKEKQKDQKICFSVLKVKLIVLKDISCPLLLKVVFVIFFLATILILSIFSAPAKTYYEIKLHVKMLI